MNLTFEPMNFINNLSYMGLGMLGIFVVIAILIISVMLLSKFTNKSNKE